ncbi:DUF4192 domain-containing protein [Mycobacterium sp. AZCC_0083]|uniref:DUF4192 domain-containing protein n=1 Tax=Mycobacterium sp. AZCC_0083 TaxID=2735882 RepID=UPI0016091E55|nr:DUF4192 domain-containing protein [Mycobacterium sp. AZCC_0083]MBB5164562.1 hypothetical protein [Mycobacterium sp. AZCC_0083]
MTTFRNADFHINKPGALIAALPAVLGFVPEKSLVLVTFDDGEMGCVMRIDLSNDVFDAVGHMAEVAATAGPDAAIAVIVDEDATTCRMCKDEHRLLADALGDALSEWGIDLLGVHVVDRVAAGGRWHCADGGVYAGSVEDPTASPMAAAAVLDGRRLYSRRADLQAVIAVADPVRTAGLRGAFKAATDAATGDADQRPDADARADVEHAMAAAAGAVEGRCPSDADLARLAYGLTDPRVRDTLYALAVGRDAASAESLWVLLARTLPEPWRAEPLVLLAFSTYARGDGPLAGVSLEAALRCNPGHRMARMLDQALQSGMRPEQIRELGLTGYRLAKQLGVKLPPRQSFGRRAG